MLEVKSAVCDEAVEKWLSLWLRAMTASKNNRHVADSLAVKPNTRHIHSPSSQGQEAVSSSQLVPAGSGLQGHRAGAKSARLAREAVSAVRLAGEAVSTRQEARKV